MRKGMDENDVVLISGTVSGEVKEDHETHGEKFYRFTVEVVRCSGTKDLLPCLIPGWLYDAAMIKPEVSVRLSGQLRSYNDRAEGERKSHLVLNIFVKEIEALNGCSGLGCNNIYLNGFLCKEPVYRRTPKGKEIADCLLAVNLAYGKSAYIPCICWGHTARRAGKLPVGANIELSGRIQSRVYQRENETEDRVAYEVSAFELEPCTEY